MEGQEVGGVEVTIDGRSLRVAKDTLVLDAAAEAGIHIPVYCAHSKLEPVAVCRMCLIRIDKAPKLQPACATRVSEGMTVTTNTPEVAKMREGVLEFLLLNHPLDCPVCDRGGECDLQDFAFRYGPARSRFPINDKVHFDKAVALSDRIELDQERCILCWRCTRYYEEITGEKELVLQQRGVQTEVAPFDGRSLVSPFQGNLPEVCPVGALTHRQYRFKARPWDLQRTRSVCPECSYGCNINVDTRDFEVKRFASRDNPLVDDMWLCDRGRYSATSWNDRDRVRRPLVRGDGLEREVSVAEAVRVAAESLAAVAERHGPTSIGVLGSTDCTNEELWLLQRLAREVIGTPHLDHQLEPLVDLTASEHNLGIVALEECSEVVVLGPEPELAAPVLTLRLFKAQTRRGVSVRRVPVDADPAALSREITGRRLVGVVAAEASRKPAAALAQALGASNQAVRRMTITRGVNGRGAKDMGVLPHLLPGYRRTPAPGKCGREILDAAAAGSIHGLLIVGGGSTLESPTLLPALRGVDVCIGIESRPGAIAAAATVLIPGHAYFEKAGTVTNSEGRVQRIRQALPPATATPLETRVLTLIAKQLGSTDWGDGDPITVNRALCRAVPAYGAAGNGGRVEWAGSGR